jgi:hypothetical protein
MVALDANQIKELLKPIDFLILDLKSAVEYYDAEEKDPRLKGEDDALIKRAQAASDLLGDIVLKIAVRQRLET